VREPDQEQHALLKMLKMWAQVLRDAGAQNGRF